MTVHIGSVDLPLRRHLFSILLVSPWSHLGPQPGEQHKLPNRSSKSSQKSVERVASDSNPVSHQQYPNDHEECEEYIDELDADWCCLYVGGAESGEGSVESF